MRKSSFKIALVISLFLLLFLPLFAKKISIKDLPLKYRNWLEKDVIYIITLKEKDVFLQLETDSERDLFIEAFWKHRDPTPGTPENEFKMEHYRRINYANKRFGFGSPKPGWQTDRGRIYIILGEPMERDIYTTQRELRDTEIWFYQEMTKYGLPLAFNVVFYRKGLGGDFELYSPNNDGPIAFFIQTPQVDPVDYLSLYEKLMEINPIIAGISLSLIPGDTPVVSDRLSLASDMLLQSINYVPQKEIKDLYAEKFLEYKSIVEVEYSTNYIESDHLVQTIKSDPGVFFVHYLIAPARLSVGQYGSDYYSRFLLNGNVTDLEGNVIYQFEKDYSFNFNEAKIKAIQQLPFQINDMFPLIPGEYRFSLLLKNTVSKEFSSFEETISIPGQITTPEMGSLLLCYLDREMKSSERAGRPFQVKNKLLFTQPGNIFLSSEKMIVYFQLYGLSDEVIEKGKLQYSLLKNEEALKTFYRDLKEYNDPANIMEEFSLSEIPAAHYLLEVSLQDQTGRDLVLRTKNFAVSPVVRLPRPFIQSKALPAINDALNDFRIGTQHFNKKEYRKAAIEFEKAFSKKPGEQDFAINLAKTYYILERYKDAESVLTPFHKEENIKYDVYFYLGKSAQARNGFARAVLYYREAVSHFGVNIFLLNALGECYFNLRNIDEARAAWEKSLEINPDQPSIREKLSLIKGKK
ncbi:MAG: GWxTD domain-containing protein [Candidatus Aminicenantes bacterium]|nr:GWxTD domain-containing protein [Candidatus Aminicenantes bacterium]